MNTHVPSTPGEGGGLRPFLNLPPIPTCHYLAAITIIAMYGPVHVSVYKEALRHYELPINI